MLTYRDIVTLYFYTFIHFLFSKAVERDKGKKGKISKKRKKGKKKASKKKGKKKDKDLTPDRTTEVSVDVSRFSLLCIITYNLIFNLCKKQ